jgi:hypothetical protein
MESKKDQALQALGTLIVIGLIIGGIVLWSSHHKKATPPQQKIPLSFQITHPDGWQEVKPTPKGTMASFSATSTESDSTGSLKPFITIQHTVLDANKAKKLTAKQITDAYVAQLPNSYSGYIEQSVSNEMLGTQPATLINFSSTQGQNALTTDALLVIKGQVVYSINGETLTSTWPQHAEEIKQSLLSFRP